MKKEIKIAIAVVLSIWFFVMGFELGIYKERKANAEANQEVVNTVTPTQNPTTTVPTTTPTTVPTTVPTTTPTTLPSTVPTSQNGEQPSASSPNSNNPASMSKQQVIDKMNDLMKTLKAEQNVNAHKYENIVVNITNCSVPSAVDMINDLIKGLVGSEEIDYAISGGQTANGETMYGIIPPTNKDFLISDAGVVSATAKTVGTDTVYTATLVEESTTVGSPVPAFNSTAIGYLDLTSLDLPGVNITEADMYYPGSTVEITVNAEGKVTKLVNKLPMTGLGVAKIAFVSGNASFEGSLDEQWTFTY